MKANKTKINKLKKELKLILSEFLCEVFDIPEEHEKVFRMANKYEEIFHEDFMLDTVRGWGAENEDSCVSKLFNFLFEEDSYYEDFNTRGINIINDYRGYIKSRYPGDQYCQRLEEYFDDITLFDARKIIRNLKMIGEQ